MFSLKCSSASLLYIFKTLLPFLVLFSSFKAEQCLRKRLFVRVAKGMSQFIVLNF